MTAIPGPAGGYAAPCGLNVVRPRAGALRALHVDPRRGTGVNWHLPGNPGIRPAAQAGVVQNI